MLVSQALIEDSPCRRCRYAEWDWGMPKNYSKIEQKVVVCRVGALPLGVEWRFYKLPVRCRDFKGLKGGGEHMGLLDFSGKSLKEIEDGLRQIRNERSGRGVQRKRRIIERKVKGHGMVVRSDTRRRLEAEAEEI